MLSFRMIRKVRKRTQVHACYFVAVMIEVTTVELLTFREQ
jgi:hypothetical protein